MTRLTDIYAAVNALLIKRYPNIKVHGKEVREGYKKPSFFVSFTPIENSNHSVNFRYKKYDIVVVYFQEQSDEIDNLEKIDEMEELFGNGFKVGERYIHVDEFEHEYIGEDDNILQFTVTIEFYDDIEKEETSDMMSEIVMNQEMR